MFFIGSFVLFILKSKEIEISEKETDRICVKIISLESLVIQVKEYLQLPRSDSGGFKQSYWLPRTMLSLVSAGNEAYMPIRYNLNEEIYFL